MHLARSRVFRFFVIVGAALAAGSCSKDDIPTTPPSPFLFTNVEVSKFVTPPATQRLTHGNSYVARFDVAYTLSPTDDAQRNNLQVLAVVNSYEANGTLTVIGSLAFTPPPLTAPGGVVSDSIGFTVPAAASFISVGARVVTRGSSITDGGKIGPYWSVQ
ncbi:MAG TPA: hypothetical protein VF514_10495 [Bacteroidota bacterium]